MSFIDFIHFCIFKHYRIYTTTPKLIDHARGFLQENRKEDAYICLTKYVHRFTNQIKKHPKYNGLSEDLNKNVAAVIKVVERLHDELLETYKKDYLLA